MYMLAYGPILPYIGSAALSGARRGMDYGVNNNYIAAHWWFAKIIYHNHCDSYYRK